MCLKCGYSLAGHALPCTCPECGEACDKRAYFPKLRVSPSRAAIIVLLPTLLLILVELAAFWAGIIFAPPTFVPTKLHDRIILIVLGVAHILWPIAAVYALPRILVAPRPRHRHPLNNFEYLGFWAELALVLSILGSFIGVVLVYAARVL